MKATARERRVKAGTGCWREPDLAFSHAACGPGACEIATRPIGRAVEISQPQGAPELVLLRGIKPGDIDGKAAVTALERRPEVLEVGEIHWNRQDALLHIPQARGLELAR